MGRILILYWHGLGDLICLTPQLRHLHKEGHAIDIICRRQAIASCLLDACPYVNELIPVPYDGGGPAMGGIEGQKKREQCISLFDQLKPGYERAHMLIESPPRRRGGKIERNSRQCGVEPEDIDVEVFISEGAEAAALDYIRRNYPDGYILQHTVIPDHPYHDWDAEPWIREHFPDLPILNTGGNGEHQMLFGDINSTFVLAREARCRVLSSSVFVHACDAMNVPMEMVNYGRPNRHGWPVDPGKIKVMMEEGKVKFDGGGWIPWSEGRDRAGDLLHGGGNES